MRKIYSENRDHYKAHEETAANEKRLVPFWQGASGGTERSSRFRRAQVAGLHIFLLLFYKIISSLVLDLISEAAIA